MNAHIFHQKVLHILVTPIITWKVKYPFMLHCPLFSTCYTVVWIKNCLKSIHVITVATMKLQTISVTQKKPSCATTKLTLFTVSKNKWNTKEDTSKFMKNAFYELWYTKKHLLGWSNVTQWKKIKPIALAIAWLKELVSHFLSQSVSQSWEIPLHKSILKFHGIFLKVSQSSSGPSQDSW